MDPFTKFLWIRGKTGMELANVRDLFVSIGISECLSIIYKLVLNIQNLHSSSKQKCAQYVIYQTSRE